MSFLKQSIALPSGRIELDLPDGVHVPSPSTVELAGLLDVQPGERVLELGCGSGLLSIAAARLGARESVAVDIDPLALETTLFNARANGVEDVVTVLEGSWYEAVSDLEQAPFDVIIAVAPQTPAFSDIGPRYGGRYGTDHLFSIIDGAGDHLEPGGGRLWLLVISLADVGAVMNRLRNLFCDVRLLKTSKRFFSREEYEGLARGLFNYLLNLRREGKASFEVCDDGTCHFRNYFIRAANNRL